MSAESSFPPADFNVVRVTAGHFEPWLELRKLLWDDPEEVHLHEMQDILESQVMAAFLLFDGQSRPVGLIEGALYLTGPEKYGYIEGWFVLPAYRRQGLGGRLLSALEQWILHQAISLVLSDTIPEVYPLSPQAHARHGYERMMQLQIFIKQLDYKNE